MLVKRKIHYIYIYKFLKHRTTEAENKYKKYKNKLTNLMRIRKKEYYKEILENNKNNIKGIWNILNSIIRNGSGQINYPKYFTDNDLNIDNMEEVVDKFNHFFVSVGPNLAEKIPDPQRTGSNNEEVIERNHSTMFLRAIEEKEIIETVNKCKNKTSTDCHDIDMKTVKSHRWDFLTTHSHLQSIVPNRAIST